MEGFFFFFLTVIFVICVLQQSGKPSVSYTEMKGAFSRGVNCVLSCDVCVMSVSVGLGCLFLLFFVTQWCNLKYLKISSLSFQWTRL